MLIPCCETVLVGFPVVQKTCVVKFIHNLSIKKFFQNLIFQNVVTISHCLSMPLLGFFLPLLVSSFIFQSLFVPHCLLLTPLIFRCFSLSLPVSPCIFLILVVFPSHSLSLSISPCISVSHFAISRLPLSLFTSLYLSLSLPIFRSIYVYTCLNARFPDNPVCCYGLRKLKSSKQLAVKLELVEMEENQSQMRNRLNSLRL